MTSISDLFPDAGKIILTAQGSQFVEQLGVDAVRQVVLAVLCGQNIRNETEPLTRRRVTIATGAIVALFAHGLATVDNFTDALSTMAIEQAQNAASRDKVNIWPSQWLIGLTGKAEENILRGDHAKLAKYVSDFETAVAEASRRCEADFGNIEMSLGFVEQDNKSVVPMKWKDITRLTAAIGSATLTIRGSDKSLYGKLFEKLVLGSVLSVLGFQYVPDGIGPQIDKVFWLSDSSGMRECDATVRLKAGDLARFDIGFIGRGNPEIPKDKLSRFARRVESRGEISSSKTFVIIDKMPQTTKTTAAALQSGSEIIQMSMQYWPRILAQALERQFGYQSEILGIPDESLGSYLSDKMTEVPIMQFITPKKVRRKKSPGQLSLLDDEPAS